jgi:hypothetical protein
MRPVLTLVPLVTLGLAVVLGAHSGAVAQEATPVITEGEMEEDITFEQISFGTVNVLPPAPATINFYRVQFAPGASFIGPAQDPSLGPQLIESGTLTVRNFTADIVIHRANGEEEVVPAGTEATLGVGDSFSWEPFVGGEIVNETDEPVVILTINIASVGAATPGEGEIAATPAA